MTPPRTADPAVRRGYAVAHLRRIQVDQDIETYLEHIDSTLEGFGGRFLVHGGDTTVVEGPWQGSLIVIEFPSIDHAVDWYRSSEYQAILPLRRARTDGWAILAAGVEPGHVATDVLAPR